MNRAALVVEVEKACEGGLPAGAPIGTPCVHRLDRTDSGTHFSCRSRWFEATPTRRSPAPRRAPRSHSWAQSPSRCSSSMSPRRMGVQQFVMINSQVMGFAVRLRLEQFGAVFRGNLHGSLQEGRHLFSARLGRRASRKRARCSALSATTREVALTSAGESLLQRCSGLLGALEDAVEQVRSSKSVPHGLLRVTASAGFGIHVLGQELPAFLERIRGLTCRSTYRARRET
jgi:hypothetical protein